MQLAIALAEGEDSALKHLGHKDLADANAKRDALVGAISGRAQSSFKDSKPHIGPLSPGCQLCGEGRWSCLFLNSICNSDCSFCPGLHDSKDVPPYAERIIFESPQDYAIYVEKLGFGGVSFSGGEPFLMIDKLVAYATALRERVGPDLYMWAYTNGVSATPERLERAVGAGLREVRFNIAARDYDLGPVRAAAKIVPRLSVEIPAVPQDEQRLRDLLGELKDIGVHHLNLHQLMVLGENAMQLSEKGYAFTRHPTPAVVESEISALETLKLALDQGIDLPINYCSLGFKERWQHRVEDLRAGRLVRRRYEGRTPYGLIRRFSIQCELDESRSVTEAFEASGASAELWEYVPKDGALYFHPSLLVRLDFQKHPVFVTYCKTVVGERETIEWAIHLRDYHDLELSPTKTIGIRVVPLTAPIPLSPSDIDGFTREELPELLRPFEVISSGLPDFT